MASIVDPASDSKTSHSPAICGEWVHPAPTQRCALLFMHRGLCEPAKPTGELPPLDGGQADALADAMDSAISCDIGGYAPGEAAYTVVQHLNRLGYKIVRADGGAL